jgi:anti-sigma regulatory factor (Ser/Thr protein kinase)
MTQPLVFYWVCADGISADSLLQQADEQGCLAEVASADSPFGHRSTEQEHACAVAKLCEPAGNLLPLILDLPIDTCVEVGAESFIDDGATDFVLVLTTANAFATDPGTAFADALITRGLVSGSRRNDLRIALHEGLANALLHGNLEIKSHPSQTPDEFLEQAADQERRLATPKYGRRPIAMTATVKDATVEIGIRDDGNGFAATSVPTVNTNRMGGHGLALMAKHSDGIRYELDGRRVILTYQADQKGMPIG